MLPIILILGCGDSVTPRYSCLFMPLSLGNCWTYQITETVFENGETDTNSYIAELAVTDYQEAADGDVWHLQWKNLTSESWPDGFGSIKCFNKSCSLSKSPNPEYELLIFDGFGADDKTETAMFWNFPMTHIGNHHDVIVDGRDYQKVMMFRYEASIGDTVLNYTFCEDYYAPDVGLIQSHYEWQHETETSVHVVTWEASLVSYNINP